MKVAVIGSRSFDDYDLLEKTLMRYDIKMIVSGGARGADELAEKYAEQMGIPIKVHYADWDKHGKSAGFIRNRLIIDDCDFVVAFWDGKSKGTLNSIQLAKKQNKKVEIIIF